MANKKLAVTSIMSGLGVVLSIFPGPIQVGPTLVFPFQSMLNVITGILVGPWYAAAAALMVGVIRISIHTGTFFSIPGGVPGAILVGLTYRLTRSYLSAFAEVPGTALIGAFLSVGLVAPAIGKNLTLWFFVTAFTPPAVIGSLMGYVVILALKRRGIIARLQL